MRLLILGPSLYFNKLSSAKTFQNASNQGFTAVDASVECLIKSRQIKHVTLISLNDKIIKPLSINHKKLSLTLIPERTQVKRKILDLFKEERKEIAKIIYKQKFDMIICHWSYEYALAVPREFSEKLIIVQHDSPFKVTVLNFSVMRIAKIIMAIKSRIKHKKSNYVAVSSETAKLNRWELLIFKKQFILPNALGFKSDTFLNIERDKRVLYIGNSSRLKRPKVAARIFSQISEKRSDFEFYMIGPGLEANSSLAKRFSGAKNLIWIGQISHSQLIELIAKSHVVVSCSKHESFGMTCMESLALGTKFISRSKLASFREICGDVKLALLSNPRTFAKNLELCLDYKYDLDEVQASTNYINDNFGCRAYSEKIVSLSGKATETP